MNSKKLASFKFVTLALNVRIILCLLPLILPVQQLTRKKYYNILKNLMNII